MNEEPTQINLDQNTHQEIVPPRNQCFIKTLNNIKHFFNNCLHSATILICVCSITVVFTIFNQRLLTTKHEINTIYNSSSLITFPQDQSFRSYQTFLALKQYTQYSVSNPFLKPTFFQNTTYNEFYLLFKALQCIRIAYNYQIDTLPFIPFIQQNNFTAIDLRPYFFQPKNQYKCASCYAFPVTASIEYLYRTKKKINVFFSQQQIIDCAYNLNGCINGSLKDSLNYILHNGLRQQIHYPYKSYQSTSYQCETQKIKNNHKFVITGYKKLAENNCSAVIEQLKKKIPVIAMMNMGQLGQYTKGQVFTNCLKHNFNHAVLVVGITTTGNWIIRNSWGANWGDYGYFQMAKDNTCGICTHSYITQLNT